MEARLLRAAFVAVMLLVSMGAKYRRANFIVDTADPRLAQQFAEAAENFRSTLAVSWLGEELPNWNQPCPVKVLVGPNLGAGGATTFTFDRGEVFGWSMSIQGSRERVLDSVLPHEVTHMIYASHFRRPLPRWADEGGATSVEHVSERNKQRASLDQYLRTGRGIPFSTMFAMTEYPADVLPLYAQGYSTAEYLIQIGGRRKYIQFLDDGLKDGNWAAALQKNYRLQSLGELQKTWLAWVKQGSPLKPQPAPPARALRRKCSRAPHRSRGSIRTWRAVCAKRPLRRRRPRRSPGRRIPVAMRMPPWRRTMLPVAIRAFARRALAPVGDKPSSEATAALSSLAGMTAAAKSNADVPYTPGSTIAVSRLSIPSTGWRASTTMPLTSAVAATTAPSNADADPYRAQVSRPQPLEGPRQTTMWR